MNALELTKMFDYIQSNLKHLQILEYGRLGLRSSGNDFICFEFYLDDYDHRGPLIGMSIKIERDLEISSRHYAEDLSHYLQSFCLHFINQVRAELEFKIKSDGIRAYRSGHHSDKILREQLMDSSKSEFKMLEDINQHMTKAIQEKTQAMAIQEKYYQEDSSKNKELIKKP